ncbi:MAG: HAD family phosphatase [Thermodesulfobacteriota bacterium]
MLKNKPGLLLFDLGGVLMDFSGVRDLPALMRTPLTEAEVRGKWASCSSIQYFESGKIAAGRFAERFVKEWDLVPSPEVFLLEFRTWVRDFFPGARELLSTLKGTFRLACLSNSNPVHWEDNAKRFEMDTLFEKALSSHQMGCLKPDPEIFLKALSLLRAEPAEVVFFDDSAANVIGARQIGMDAFQVSGVEELRACLQDLGFISTGR